MYVLDKLRRRRSQVLRSRPQRISRRVRLVVVPWGGGSPERFGVSNFSRPLCAECYRPQARILGFPAPLTNRLLSWRYSRTHTRKVPIQRRTSELRPLGHSPVRRTIQCGGSISTYGCMQQNVTAFPSSAIALPTASPPLAAHTPDK